MHKKSYNFPNDLMFWAIPPWWMFSLMLTLRQREGFRVIDNRPESLIYVQGGDVQALFNFLLNCRSCVASSGPQAGVPPTIISPSPFTGASIHSDKVRLKYSKAISIRLLVHWILE